MFSHVQTTQSGEFVRLIPAGVNIEWDANNFCTAFALEQDGKAEQFGVFPYFTVGRPEHNTITQGVRELAPALIDGNWTQRWEVYDLAPEDSAANLAAAQSAAWERIKAERDRRKSAGVKVGANWFHSDDSSRIQQMALFVMGANLPAGLQWKVLTLTPPPVFVTMTQTLAAQIFQATAASDTAIFAAAEAHRIAMEASADPAAYSIDSGWPVAIWEE